MPNPLHPSHHHAGLTHTHVGSVKGLTGSGFGVYSASTTRWMKMLGAEENCTLVRQGHWETSNKMSFLKIP